MASEERPWVGNTLLKLINIFVLVKGGKLKHSSVKHNTCIFILQSLAKSHLY